MMIWLSDDPDVPQVLLVHQFETYFGDCEVYIAWSLPSNTAPDDISHFTISINGTHVDNETRNTNETLTTIVYSLCSCGSHNISISAVNRCGRSSRSVIVTVDGQLPTPQLIIDCQDKINTTSDTTTSRNEYQSMYTGLHQHIHGDVYDVIIARS